MMEFEFLPRTNKASTMQATTQKFPPLKVHLKHGKKSMQGYCFSDTNTTTGDIIFELHR